MLASMKTSKTTSEETVKTTMKLPRNLWETARIRAFQERIDFQELVALALAAYLEKPAKGKGGAR
jgi:hypothetical protein